MNILLAPEEASSSLPESIPISNRTRSATSGRARILYVDDDESIREMGQQLLERFGYEVDTAADGDEALAALRKKSYQLLITDQSMPHRTGAELIVQVRQDGMRLPIVITSEVWGLRPVAAARPHIAAFLPKPFAAVELLEAVKQVLERTMGAGPAELAIRSMVKRASSPPLPPR